MLSHISIPIAIVTDRGQIALGIEHKGKQFVVEVLASGDILLRRNSTFKAELLASGDALIVRTFVDVVDAVGKKATSGATPEVPLARNQRLRAGADAR